MALLSYYFESKNLSHFWQQRKLDLKNNLLWDFKLKQGLVKKWALLQLMDGIAQLSPADQLKTN